MAELTYESIKPLIVKEEVQGSSMYCTFKCPVSGYRVDATASIQRAAGAARNVADSVKQSVKYSVMWQIRMAIYNFVRSLLGGGVAGQVGSQAAYAATSSIGSGSYQSTSYNAAEKQAAVVAAFQSVASNFKWDEAGRRWTHA